MNPRLLFLCVCTATAALIIVTSAAQAVVSRGTGTGALVGSDLTDIGNDGVEGNYNPPVDRGGFDATFFSSDEPGFGGGEFAFNVFDNVVGGGNDKWCCGSSFPQIVGAQLDAAFRLTSFTVSSANDTPDRDPRVWRIEGSNDGATWDTIFSQNDPQSALWTQRNEVLFFEEGTDYPLQTDAYEMLRMVTDATNLTGGAFFQISEIEFFGVQGSAVPEPATAMLGLLGLGALGLRRRRTV